MSVVDISKVTTEESKITQFANGQNNAIVDTDLVERTPEIVAAEIRQIADQTRKMVLNSSIEIGKRLCEAKEMVPHGEWRNWLEKEVNFRQSTANNLMRIYTEYGDIQGELWGASAKSQTFGNLTYSQAVALLAVPAEEREEFVEKNDVENMSTRELQEAIKARDEALAAKEAAEQDAMAADQAKQDAEEKLKTEKAAADERVRAAQRQAESVMEELDKLKSEIKNSDKQKEIEKTKAQLKEAKDKLNAYKEQKKQQIEEAGKVQEQQQKEINRLKAELAAAEAKDPEPSEEAQAEIEKLKAKLEEAQKLAGDEATVKFKILFQNVQDEFYGLMDAVNEIRDETARAKRKKAIKVLLQQLLEEVDK
ncbi:MAG: DUF3102 domain-containing protein [Acidaminococcaceae bacterium]|nr:DUF3102 domain-containing protein [Acidaminococcaceae bacterium]